MYKKRQFLALCTIILFACMIVITPVGVEAEVTTQATDRDTPILWIKTTSGEFVQLTPAEFTSLDKSTISWVFIETQNSYYGFFMSGGNWGHGEFMTSPKPLKEPLLGVFIRFHAKTGGTWSEAWFTNDNLGDFRNALYLNEENFGTNGVKWTLGYYVTVTVSGRQFDFRYEVVVTTYDNDAKLNVEVRPHDAYQDFAIEYCLVQNPTVKNTHPQYKVTKIKYHDGTTYKDVPINVAKSIDVDNPNYQRKCDLLAVSNARIHNLNFLDLTTAPIDTLQFRIEQETLPDNNQEYVLKVGGRANRPIQANELLVYDPLINTDPEVTDYLFKGDWYDAGQNWIADTLAEDTTKRDGYYNNMDNDVVTNDGWTYGESDADFRHDTDAGGYGTTPANQRIDTIITSGDTGDVYYYKTFYLTSDENVWSGLAVRSYQSEYANQMTIDFDFGASGKQYSLWIDDDTAVPSNTANRHYEDLANVDGTYFYWTGNLTQLANTEFSLTDFDDYVKVRVYIWDNSASGGAEIRADDFFIHGQADNVCFPDFGEGEIYSPEVMFYDLTGYQCLEPVGDAETTEMDQIIPITGLDLDASPKQYYFEWELNSAFDGTGATGDCDRLTLQFRIGAAGGWRTINILRSTTTANDTNGIGDDVICIEVGTDTSGTIDITSLFDSVGWLDDGIDRLTLIRVNSENLNDNRLDVKEYKFYEGAAGAGPTIASDTADVHINTGNVNVTATITDVSGVDTAILEYYISTDNSTWGSMTNKTMYNSGSSYQNNSVTLDNQYMKWRIVANDTVNNWSQGSWHYDKYTTGNTAPGGGGGGGAPTIIEPIIEVVTSEPISSIPLQTWHLFALVIGGVFVGRKYNKKKFKYRIPKQSQLFVSIFGVVILGFAWISLSVIYMQAAPQELSQLPFEFYLIGLAMPVAMFALARTMKMTDVERPPNKTVFESKEFMPSIVKGTALLTGASFIIYFLLNFFMGFTADTFLVTNLPTQTTLFAFQLGAGTIFFLNVVLPFLEELLFRFVVPQTLAPYMDEKGRALLSAAVFGGFHYYVAQMIGLAYFIYFFAGGLIFYTVCYSSKWIEQMWKGFPKLLRFKGAGIVASFIVHVIFNLMALYSPFLFTPLLVEVPQFPSGVPDFW